MTTALDRSFTYRLHLLHKVSDHESHQSYLEKLGLSLSEARSLAAIGAFEPMSIMSLADKGNLNKGQASRAARSWWTKVGSANANTPPMAVASNCA